MAKTLLVVGTITRGGRDEIRILVKEPFTRDLEEHVGKTVLLVVYLPETEPEKVLSAFLKESRIRS